MRKIFNILILLWGLSTTGCKIYKPLEHTFFITKYYYSQTPPIVNLECLWIFTDQIIIQNNREIEVVKKRGSIYYIKGNQYIQVLERERMIRVWRVRGKRSYITQIYSGMYPVNSIEGNYP